MDSNSPFTVPNVRLFFWFRILANARFYYPVFTVLFLDFGLTLEQFSILNLIWAATIVLLEVPSGALADTIGRAALVKVAGICMVLEMALISFVPLGNGSLIFWIFCLNRILSGIMEAAASGADEALAYDSLAEVGKEDLWPRVLEVLMRWQSAAFVIASIIGAGLYDAKFLSKITGIEFAQETTMRFPLYGVLLSSIAVLIIALKMREIGDHKKPEGGTLGATLAATRTTLKAGRWILKTPFVFVIILAGFTFDHIIREILTINSEYYRTIGLPEASFGLVGASMACLGIFLPTLAKHLAEKRTPAFNYLLLTGLTLIGLTIMSLTIRHYGVLAILFLMPVMHFGGFFQSHYLNRRISDPKQRATVLSFKGLSFNLAYGGANALYALLVSNLKKNGTPQEQVFDEALKYFPAYFLIVALTTAIIGIVKLRQSKQHLKAG